MRLPHSRSWIALAAAGALAPAAVGVTIAARADSLTPGEQALHVLNRLGFGPRPGDIDRVLRMGVTAHVLEQMYPERIPDGRVEARLAGFETLSMSNAALIERFEMPIREAKRKIKAEKASMSSANAETTDADLPKLRLMIPAENRPGRILDELTAARILRASESERQLNEVLVDFWMNHFNVYARKGEDRIAIVAFERDTIRPHVFGRFEDLLQATAKSPAMLVYLDNARSVADEEHRPAMAAVRLPGNNAPKGLNENYARELMELHTLGVDGGYTQKDVTELARVLTGWSIGRPRLASGQEQGMLRASLRQRPDETPGSFLFRARAHDAGAKTVLGTTFPAGGGIEEGEKALAMLARNPATARHIAFELCQRLVADEPPKELVERVAKRFLATGGDLRETVRTIVTSPEFFDPQYYRAKIKSPFEYVVSAVRAVGGSTDGKALARQIAEMGEPLYLCQPPTGYADTADTWVNSGALLARLNFALALAQGKLPGTTVEATRLPVGGPPRSVDAAAHWLVGTDISVETLETISKRAAESADPAESAALIAGLILGSPEFQKQ
jgi:uncharacterized protein (DUF1800 family)